MRARFEAPTPTRTLARGLVAACAAADFGRDVVALGVKLKDPSAGETEVRAAVRAWLAGDPPNDPSTDSIVSSRFR